VPSTYSTSLKLQLIGTGEQAGVWGTTTNTNLGTLLEQAITGVITIPMGDATYTLSNFNGLSDEARNAVLILNGPITAPQFLVTPPGQQKVYIVRNRTGNTVTLTTGTGSNISVANAASEVLFTDGANVFSATQFNFINGNLTVTGTATANNLVATNNITLGKDLFANSSTGQVYLPKGNTATRTSSPTTGIIRYNSEQGIYEGYSNSVWVRFLTVPQGNYTINYLLVAGGGSGGFGSGNVLGSGGGGAGGTIDSSLAAVPGTQYVCVVGAGGGSNAEGTQSQISGIQTVTGGGRGGYYTGSDGAGTAGGSGGGAASRSGSNGAGTAGQGFAGGSGAFFGAGGGGGAAQLGGSATDVVNSGANGGNGLLSTTDGVGNYYGGGGGGGGGQAAGSGGLGGGGTGGYNNVDTGNFALPTNGTVNTGGGGGGTATFLGGGGTGGSGVIIFKIPTASYTGTYTGSPTISVVGGFTFLKFTASGTYTA
jgi:hypothetical protein